MKTSRFISFTLFIVCIGYKYEQLFFYKEAKENFSLQ